MVLEQVRMGAGTLENNFTRRLVNFIDKHPVALDMTFKRVFPLAVKRMVFTLRGQGLFLNDHVNDFPEFTEIPALFSHQVELFFETFCKPASQHGLIVHVVVRVVLHKVFPHLVSRIVPLTGNLPPENGSAFLNGGDGFGVKKLFARHRVAVRRANGAFAFIVKPIFGNLVRPLVYSRSKGNYSPPRRNFARHINGQPVAGRYFYGFRNVHKVSIA